MSAYVTTKQVARYYNDKYFAYINKFRVGFEQCYQILILKRKSKEKQEFKLGIDCSIEFLEAFIKDKIGKITKA